MPKSSRIDAPGALNHVVVRGIGRWKIFNEDPYFFGTSALCSLEFFAGEAGDGAEAFEPIPLCHPWRTFWKKNP
jgi:hypothetical protein